MYGAVSDLWSATLCVRSLWTCFSKRVVRGNHCERGRSLSGKRRDGVPSTRKTGARFRNPRGYEGWVVWAGGKGVVERNKTYTLTKEEMNPRNVVRTPKRCAFAQSLQTKSMFSALILRAVVISGEVESSTKRGFFHWENS